MRTPKYHLYMTPKEQSEVLKALVDLKNRLISENRYTDAVDDVIVKISKAKKKHMKILPASDGTTQTVCKSLPQASSQILSGRKTPILMRVFFITKKMLI